MTHDRPNAPRRATQQLMRVVEINRTLRQWSWHDPHAHLDMIKLMRIDPDGIIREGQMLKDGDRCTVVKLDLEGGAVVLKRYNAKGALHTAVHSFLRSRARWSFLNGRRLLTAGLLTPRPLACIEERRAGVLRLRSYLLTEFVAGSSLAEMARRPDLTDDDLRSLAAQFAYIWQTLGQLRIGHGDMKATNFIVDAQKRLWMIDLDGMRIHHSRTMLRRERRNDLDRFMRNWTDQPPLPKVAAIFRARIGIG